MDRGQFLLASRLLRPVRDCPARPRHSPAARSDPDYGRVTRPCYTLRVISAARSFSRERSAAHGGVPPTRTLPPRRSPTRTSAAPLAKPTPLSLGRVHQLQEVLLRIAVVLLARAGQPLLGEAQRPRPLARRQHRLGRA